MAESPFTLEFYRSPDGKEPARDWIRRRLSVDKRRALAAALHLILARQGVGVCATPYGRQLGRGLFEFRLDEDEATLLHKWSPDAIAARHPTLPGRSVLLRVFCHATGDRVILILGGYDKGRSPSPRKQQREIALARARLKDFKARRLE